MFNESILYESLSCNASDKCVKLVPYRSNLIKIKNDFNVSIDKLNKLLKEILSVNLSFNRNPAPKFKSV